MSLLAASPDVSRALGSLGMMVLGTTTPLPAEASALAVAMRHGFWLALALIWTGAMAGAMLSYGAGYFAGARDWLMRYKHVRAAMARLDHLGWTGILGLRLIPLVPYFALSLAAGLLRVPLGRYLLGTSLGILPATIILALLGQGLISGSTGTIVATVLAMLALCLLGYCLRRQQRMAHGGD